MEQTIFYCYTDGQQAHAEPVKPENFDSLDSAKEVPATTRQIAEMYFLTMLKREETVKKWG